LLWLLLLLLLLLAPSGATPATLLLLLLPSTRSGHIPCMAAVLRRRGSTTGAS
jgi:hypothetical protein